MAKELTTDLEHIEHLEEVSFAVEQLSCAIKGNPGDHLKELSFAVEELTNALKGEPGDRLTNAILNLEVVAFHPIWWFKFSTKLGKRLTNAIMELEYVFDYYWKKEMELTNKKQPERKFR